jgi:nitrogen regulatory protein P-II 2
MTDESLATTPLRLLTIVAESVLEDRLVREILARGASGYTASRAHGQGSRETRASALGGNVRIEVVVDEAIERDLLALLARDYFPSYAVIAWSHEVSVVRGAKYGRMG